MPEKKEISPVLSMKEQQKNLAAALIDAGLPFMVDGYAVTLQYLMERPKYVEILNTLNTLKANLLREGKVDTGVNYTRGPMIDANGHIHEKIEQLVFFFGTDQEFEEFKKGIYPPPKFFGYNPQN